MAGCIRLSRLACILRIGKPKDAMKKLIVLSVMSVFCLSAKPRKTLGSVKRIFIEKMPNDLDQYLRAEIGKQFKGRVTVVLDKAMADGILTGIDEERKGTGAQITGRYLGLHDNATGSISLLDKEGKSILGPTRLATEACCSAS